MVLPGNATLGQYLRFATAAFISMFLGSQFVHLTYLPLKDMDKFIAEEIEKLPEEQRKKIKL